ncbi:MAG: TolC family protein [Luteibaculaceae bacterium]
MKTKNYLFLFFYLCCFGLNAQDILSNYIKEGLNQNLSIKEQNFALEKSIYALKEAKSLFLPNISLQSDYFLAGGGRTVDFPAGDLLNPVYGTLNQLTASNNFPQLENQSILLNPDNFYDARVRTTLPIVNLEIEYNKRIKKQQVSLQKIEINLYKRNLVKEIKQAYFQYLQAYEAIKIYENALELVKENSRINQALFKNNQVNRTVLIRAENEVIKYEAQLANAFESAKTAKAYFNFLLNKPLTDSIEIDTKFSNNSLVEVEKNNVKNREELKKLSVADSINQQLVKLANSSYLPKLNAFLDLGSQGFDFDFNDKTRYYFFGVSLQWNLFAGGKNQHKVQQAKIDYQSLQLQKSYAEKQLELQLQVALNQFTASKNNHTAAVSSLQASNRLFADVLKQYKEGNLLYIELLDAQNQLVQSEIQTNLSLYDTFIKATEVERANASFNLNNY